MSRRPWLLLLAAIIAAGLLSRTLHTGQPLLDKYLGDALYAAMVYVLIRLTGLTPHVALWAALAMTAIELFQLTAIPAHLYRSPHLPLRLAARLGREDGHGPDPVALCVIWIIGLAVVAYIGPTDHTLVDRDQQVVLVGAAVAAMD
ncbi:MAG: DUF2809 domain-containing protein, partial [Acidobacteria bacterium]|nr:DUF2809 domain-containing protein [Acidobacteriota bacterium]